MKKLFTLLSFLCIGFIGMTQTLSPGETTEFCPVVNYESATNTTPNVQLFQITVNSNINEYTLAAATRCKIISNISPVSGDDFRGNFYIAFEDQRSNIASVVLQRKSNGATVHTFKFNYIRSLKGLKPTIIHPSLNLPLCNTGNIPYNITKVVKYQTSAGTEFGNLIPFYEYSVPEGWQVDGVTSTGQNNYILATPGAAITYDEIHTGEIKIRASQRGYICATTTIPAAGDWVTIPFTRPVLKLTASGTTSLTIPCGTTQTHTFTLENANSLSCASYEWDLESANNNWIYNGSPAPQIIPSNTNSITLTSTLCGVPSSVSVKIKINNIYRGTFKVPVITTLPQFTITGPNQICQDNDFTINNNNLPCNATVSWSLSDNTLAAMTVNGNTATLRALRNGKVTLTAAISGVCGGSPTTVSHDIITGAIPTIILGPYDPVTHNTQGVACFGRMYYFEPYPVTPGINYTWSITPPNPDDGILLFRGTRAIVNFSDWGCYTIHLEQEGGCISPETTDRIICSQECWNDFTVTLSPNPSKNDVTVTVDDNGETRAETAKKETVRIQMFQFNTGRKEKEWTYNNAQNKFILNVRGLKKGIYVLTITKGKIQKSQQLIIE
jgi:hypothetical protein